MSIQTDDFAPVPPKRVVSAARQDLFEIREGILKLMDEFRGRGC